MDGLTLLRRTQDGGLRLEVATTSLKISGPKEAEPLVRLLAKHKALVLDVLQKVQEVQKVPGPGSASAGNERDPGPYASALVALLAKCPAYVPDDRWREAVADATAFVSEWGAESQAFGWAARELFGLHPALERPAANYSRLSRLDDMGLLWLLRSRPVTTLTATEAAYRCPSGAILTYRRLKKPVSGPLMDERDENARRAT